MKAKAFLFILAAVLLLSFTVVSSKSNEHHKTAEVKQQPAHVDTHGGLVMEDRNLWD